MPTLTRKPRSIKPDTCALSITIRDTAYAVRPLPVDPASGVAVLVRLRKPDGETYHVARHTDGLASCDCGDYTFRHAGNGTACKHIKALDVFGLLGGGRDLAGHVRSATVRAREEGCLDGD